MAEVFALSMPLWEIALRATVAYLGIVIFIRIVPKRNAGTISPNDLLTLIVIGALGTDAIAGGSTSLGDILLMIALVIAWSFVFDLLEYRVPLFRRLLRHRQTTLVLEGRMLRRNMEREMVTEDELMAVLREHGVAEVEEVKSACLEADGEISVVKKRSARP